MSEKKLKSVKCEYCGNVYQHRQSAHKHVKICTQNPKNCEKVFKCAECKKEFKRQDVLSRHIKLSCKKEIADESHECKICGKIFARKYNLKRHQLVHEKQHPLNECDICKKTFKRLDHLEKHRCEPVEQDSFSEKEDEEIDVVTGDYQELTDFSMVFSEFESQLSESQQSLDLIELHDEDIQLENSVNAVRANTPESLDRPLALALKSVECEKTSTPRFCRQLETPDKNVQINESSLMSPGSRKRKSRIAEMICSSIKQYHLTKSDQFDVLSLAMKNLGLMDQLKFVEKPSRSGRKLTNLATREQVWKFWHENSVPSTNTQQISKLRVCNKPKIQSNLEFVSTVMTVQQRNRSFYQGIHQIVEKTIRELYTHYIFESEEQHHVSLGTFMALKPFYVRQCSTKDIEMCCCKLHLHARWSIKALFECCSQQSIDLGPVNDYYSFFDYLSSECATESTTHISWQCVTGKRSLCQHSESKWKQLVTALRESSNDSETVIMFHFKKMPCKKKNGQVVERLKAVREEANMVFLIDFIDSLLPKIVHHRNHLQHFRKVHPPFLEIFNAAYLDIDFSENLTVPVKYEPQSLHWAHEQITVHSGILKIRGNKSYHPYFSDSKVHDQIFVDEVIKEMISGDEIESVDIIIIESDNCSCQFKSAQHFFHLQEISNNTQKVVIRIYGVAGHGKGEVDHVGGLAKVSVRKEVAAGAMFMSSAEVALFIDQKFKENSNPHYIVKEITSDVLDERRAMSNLIVHPTVEGSSKFQAMVFRPNATSFKAAERLCVCNECHDSYGSCSLFTSYELRSHKLNKAHLRSQKEVPSSEEGAIDDNHGFIIPDSVVAVAAEEASVDPLWFIKVVEIDCEGNGTDCDGYGHIVPSGVVYNKGHFMEKSVISTTKYSTYKLSKKVTYFYKESVVYPFVNFDATKKGFSLKMTDYTDILHFVESNSYAHI